MTPLPCPHCGATMAPMRAGNGVDVVGYSHPRGACLREGVHVGSQLVALWNTRALHYTLTDGLPVFNGDGVGTAITVAELNSFFAFLREQQQQGDNQGV